MVNELYPFKSNFLKLEGLNYHYIDEGTGDPVVMLHGNPTWSFYYRNLVLALQGSFRTIVPDHIGCGLSDKPDESVYEYTLKNRVDDLEQLLNSLTIEKDITLILHDWGGMIGMAYASRFPERIKALVVLNTGAFRLPEKKQFPFLLRLGRDSPVGAFLIQRFNAFCLLASFICSKNGLQKDVRKAYLSPYRSFKDRIAILKFVQDIPLRPQDKSYDLVVEVENSLNRFLQIPLLILWGEKDFVFDHHFLDEWKRHFPDAEVHSFPDAGHYILEDKKDEVVSLIHSFLKKR